MPAVNADTYSVIAGSTFGGVSGLSPHETISKILKENKVNRLRKLAIIAV
jgi:hypothetical protein